MAESVSKESPMSHKGASRKVVFVDRDGVINAERHDYVKSWEEFRFLPGAPEALARLSANGFEILIVTNQSALHRGLLSDEGLAEIHRQMLDAIARVGGVVRDVLVCPHTPDEDCDCRKPRPGLLLQAARRHGLDLSTCYLVGDKLTDIAAGQAVGCRCVLVATGLEPLQPAEQPQPQAGYGVCETLDRAIEWIVADWAQRVGVEEVSTCRY